MITNDNDNNQELLSWSRKGLVTCSATHRLTTHKARMTQSQSCKFLVATQSPNKNKTKLKDQKLKSPTKSTTPLQLTSSRLKMIAGHKVNALGSRSQEKDKIKKIQKTTQYQLMIQNKRITQSQSCGFLNTTKTKNTEQKYPQNNRLSAQSPRRTRD